MADNPKIVRDEYSSPLSNLKVNETSPEAEGSELRVASMEKRGKLQPIIKSSEINSRFILKIGSFDDMDNIKPGKGMSSLSKKAKLPSQKLNITNKIYPKALDSERKHMKQPCETEIREKSDTIDIHASSVLEQTAGMDYGNRGRPLQHDSADNTNVDKNNSPQTGIKKFKDRITNMKLKLPSPKDASQANVFDEYHEEGEYEGRHVPDSDLYDSDYNPADVQANNRRRYDRENSMQVRTGKYDGSEMSMIEKGPLSATRKSPNKFDDDFGIDSDSKQKQNALLEFNTLKTFGKLSVKHLTRNSNFILL